MSNIVGQASFFSAIAQFDIAGLAKGIVAVFYEFIFGPGWAGIQRLARFVFTPIRILLVTITVIGISMHMLAVAFLKSATVAGTSIGTLTAGIGTSVGTVGGTATIWTQPGISFLNGILPLQEMLNACCFLISVGVCIVAVRVVQTIVGKLGFLVSAGAVAGA